MAEAVKKASYLLQFLSELGFSEMGKLRILCDNNGARKLAENPIYYNRTKHIDTRHHYLREVINRGSIKIEHIPTTEMASDFLTKGVPTPKHRKCLELLGLSSQAPS